MPSASAYSRKVSGGLSVGVEAGATVGVEVRVGVLVEVGDKVDVNVAVGNGVSVGTSVAVGFGEVPQADKIKLRDVAPLNLRKSRRVSFKFAIVFSLASKDSQPNYRLGGFFDFYGIIPRNHHANKTDYCLLSHCSLALTHPPACAAPFCPVECIAYHSVGFEKLPSASVSIGGNKLF